MREFPEHVNGKSRLCSEVLAGRAACKAEALRGVKYAVRVTGFRNPKPPKTPHKTTPTTNKTKPNGSNWPSTNSRAAKEVRTTLPFHPHACTLESKCFAKGVCFLYASYWHLPGKAAVCEVWPGLRSTIPLKRCLHGLTLSRLASQEWLGSFSAIRHLPGTV